MQLSPNTGKYGPEITPYSDTFHPEVFLEILQNSQENTCARVSFLIKLQASGRFSFLIKLQALVGCFSIATFLCLFIKIENEIVLRFPKITIKCCRLKYHFALHFLVLPYFKKFFTLTYCEIFLPLCNF